MPGGYGTSGPWGSSGSTTGTTKPGTSGGYSGGSNQQADNINRQREERREQQSNAYLNDASNFQTAQQQMAASLQAAGAVTSGALGGQALWNKIPADVADKIRRSGGDPTLYGNEYYSTFAEGAQAYSPTGIISISGEGGIPAYKGRDPETGELIPWDPDDWQYELANKYKIVNPYYGGSGGGGGGWGGYGGYGGYGGGGGGGGSSYGGPPKERPQFPGQPGERWGQQMPLQQAMINIHGGPGFQQGFARGGIVSLVE